MQRDKTHLRTVSFELIVASQHYGHPGATCWRHVIQQSHVGCNVATIRVGDDEETSVSESGANYGRIEELLNYSHSYYANN
jgi:hypothetical protein